MKQWILGGGFAIGTLLLAAYVLQGQTGARPAADTKKDKRTINTSGSATIKVKPDSARVFFGVQTIAETIKQAREGNSATVKKVMDKLVALKIPGLKMKTANLSVELVHSHQRDVARLPEVLGYRVTNSLTVLVSDPDAVKLSTTAGTVLDAALESGANFVQQIVFFKQDEAEIKRQALSKAVEEALTNAKAIAEGAKVQIVDTLSMEGQPEYTFGPGQCGLTNRVIAPGGADGETPLVIGDLEIMCRVNVSCTY